MIRKFNYIMGLVLSLSLASCAYDNYEPPKSAFKGRLVYKSEAINLAQGQVDIRLIQAGFAKETPISVSIAQDGSFSALLFDGEYQLYLPNVGPYVPQPDKTPLIIKGSTTQDIEVVPYYMVKDVSITPSTGRMATASFKLEKIVADAKAIKKVSLFVNKTQFVDIGNSLVASTKDGAGLDLNALSLSVAVPIVKLNPGQKEVFARVGVEIDGVSGMLFSKVIKITLVD
ncbi:MAG: DUF3823 domain-containing protein [Bacteroidota bacterium]